MKSTNQFFYHSSASEDINRSLSFDQRRLEQLWKALPPAEKALSENHTPWYKQLGQWLVQSLTDSEQVRVWTKITPNGIAWHAYDPKIQRSFSCYSETDLRIWLEQRHQG